MQDSSWLKHLKVMQSRNHQEIPEKPNNVGSRTNSRVCKKTTKPLPADDVRMKQLDIISQDRSHGYRIRIKSFSPSNSSKDYNRDYWSQLHDVQEKRKVIKHSGEIPAPDPFKMKRFKDRDSLVKKALKVNDIHSIKCCYTNAGRASSLNRKYQQDLDLHSMGMNAKNGPLKPPPVLER